MITQLISFLEQFSADGRRLQFLDVAKQRTRYLTIVLEDIYQTQNASAVLRSCDCFGVQDVHIIENRNSFNINPQVVIGATKWLHLHRYNEEKNNTRQALRKLKDDGYRIVATSPHHNDVDLEALNLHNGKLAVVFGNERDGISEIVKEEADEFMKIPMFGFSESLNISVCTAISIQHITSQLRNSEISWQLPNNQLNELYLEWLKKSIKKSGLLIEEFNKRNNTNF
ncbi:TrmH family RNA methyltransferase [Carboxylicivirga marina]|uniref:tRNA (guanosine(18)-2'-O)-methyltransferase n=1 Tax=Carboxylicivirga marina TaxID=2800988 RepID=A0ABS1HQI0_9BACT|nr:RNA methyltransferase [Carboxylicivirga marina]MBK3519875.1 RNA methyltransferase [Carboxylicivirga marina]